MEENQEHRLVKVGAKKAYLKRAAELKTLWLTKQK